MAFIRRTTIICLFIISMAAIAGCGRGTVNAESERYGSTGPKKIAVVMAASGKLEQEIKDSVVAGVRKAADDLDAQYKVFAPGDLVNNEESLRFAAENSYNLVLAIGEGIEEDLQKVAPDYPDIKFVTFDGAVEEPNVAIVSFNEDEGAFLAGVAAASLTRTNLVGFLGGSMISADRKLESGFARGVQYINTTEGKSIKIKASYAGVTDKAAGDPERGKTLAQNLFWTGTDVVFSGPGNMANGAASAASENRKIVLSSDLQLMKKLPWNVSGALVKNHENVVYNLIKKAFGEEFTGGKKVYGLAAGAVDFVFSQAVPQEVSAKLEAVKEQLKKGQIKPASIQVPPELVTQVSNVPVDLNKQQPAQSPPTRTNPDDATGQNMYSV